MTDLTQHERMRLMAVVLTVESHVRRRLRPDKMNLASLGNLTPHLHWHVIPRWRDDQHFPDPIWLAPRHLIPAPSGRVAEAREMMAALPEALSVLAAG